MSLYNLKNPAVKRLMREAEELRFPTKEYHAQPLEDNLFEWHFTLSGPPNTEFEGGVYHGRITLPPDYPMKPPSIILLTPNGRFETNKKICLSISGYHPESWQPSWSIRTALLAIIGFLPTHGNGAIGSLDYTPEERKELAIKSQSWKCSQCGYIKQYLVLKERDSFDEKTSFQARNDELLNKEESLSLSPEPNTATQSKNSIPSEENIPNFQKTRGESSKISTVSSNSNSPDSSLQQETILRHRESNFSYEDNRDTFNSDLTRPRSGNWSYGVMWVIIILLGILMLRRIMYQ